VDDRAALIADLDAARATFHEALASVDLELATVPGVMEDWSVRDIVHHLARWCGHGAEAVTLAAEGRGDAFAYSTDDTDRMNEAFLAAGRRVSPPDALAMEEAAFSDFRSRIEGLADDLLALRLGNGDTVEEVIVYDGAEHYAEHTEHLRAWFGGDEADEEPD
jgi:hypothetical protein